MPPFFVWVQLLGTSRAEEKFDTAALYHRDTLFYLKNKLEKGYSTTPMTTQGFLVTIQFFLLKLLIMQTSSDFFDLIFTKLKVSNLDITCSKWADGQMSLHNSWLWVFDFCNAWKGASYGFVRKQGTRIRFTPLWIRIHVKHIMQYGTTSFQSQNCPKKEIFC